MAPAVSPWRVLSELVHLGGTLCPSHRWLQVMSVMSKGNILCACCQGELLELEHGESACPRPLRGRPWHHFHSIVNQDVEAQTNGADFKAWVCCQCDTKVAFEVAPPVVPLRLWKALTSRQTAVAVLKMLAVYQHDFIQNTPRSINAKNSRFLEFMTAEGYFINIIKRNISYGFLHTHTNNVNQ